MLKMEKFNGINNVLAPQFLGPGELEQCVNVDIDLTGKLIRRAGYSEISASCHKNLWQARGFMLATINGNALVAFTPGGSPTVVHPAMGTARVWYCNLPDGRTTFSNGLINGITDGTTTTTWGVPVPASVGAFTDVAGQLAPGSYQYALTYVRTSDGEEGGCAFSAPFTTAQGGVVLTALPELAGHSINVYIDGYFAGNTSTSVFSYTGTNAALVMPCRTEHMVPAPVGTVTAFWRGRTLVAEGPTLYASRQSQWGLFDVRRDFKQFSHAITLIQPVDGGMFVGTTKELAFLSGTEFDKLTYSQVVAGPVVLGSGVAVPGELIRQGEGAGPGTAMMCIADRVIVAGFSNGNVLRLTEGRYETDAQEVAATFRMINRIPQYIAVPQ